MVFYTNYTKKGCFSFLFFVLFILSFSSCESSKKGKQFPEFKLQDINGNEIDHQSLGGKTVVINIWGTWCGPCVGEINDLNELVEKYEGEQNILFIALAKESTDKIQNFVKRRPFKYLQIADAETLTDQLHPGVIDEIPHHIIVNKEGIIVFEMTGATNDIIQILSQEIDRN